jgi:NitT/TauT family transport system permease protein
MATRADEALPAATADNLPWGRGRGLGDGLVRVAAPLLVGALILLAWELVVRVNEIPHYILPAPSLVWQELLASWPTLWPSLLVTLQIASLALAAAVVGGVGLAVLCSLSRWVELALFPYAVILQVTPVVSVAPLIRSTSRASRRR